MFSNRWQSQSLVPTRGNYVAATPRTAVGAAYATVKIAKLLYSLEHGGTG